MTKNDDPSRFGRLQSELQDWGIAGDYETFDAWMEYQTKNILPFEGGWLNQPRWIRRAFQTLNKVYALEYEQKDRFEFTAESDTSFKMFPFSLKADKQADG